MLAQEFKSPFQAMHAKSAILLTRKLCSFAGTTTLHSPRISRQWILPAASATVAANEIRGYNAFQIARESKTVYQRFERPSHLWRQMR